MENVILLSVNVSEDMLYVHFLSDVVANGCFQQTLIIPGAV